MTALTTDLANAPHRLFGSLPFDLAAVKCIKGGMAMVNAAGFVTPATAEASNNGVIGVFERTIDNSGGSAGDYLATIIEGEFLFTAVSIVQGSVGAVMYALDDQTFDETQLANQPQCGKLTRFVSATSGYIALSLALAS